MAASHPLPSCQSACQFLPIFGHSVSCNAPTFQASGLLQQSCTPAIAHLIALVGVTQNQTVLPCTSRKARRPRTGMGLPRAAMRQVADAATQTALPPATPVGAAPWVAGRPGASEEQQQLPGQAAMYGVNAAVATSKSSTAGAKPVWADANSQLLIGVRLHLGSLLTRPI